MLSEIDTVHDLEELYSAIAFTFITAFRAVPVQNLGQGTKERKEQQKREAMDCARVIRLCFFEVSSSNWTSQQT